MHLKQLFFREELPEGSVSPDFFIVAPGFHGHGLRK
jgi:hypothetical protein